MASIYMRIDGVQVSGGATIEGLPGEGWFAISSYSWGAVRSVAMDIGNGTNADSGMVAMSEVNISKEADGASEDLLSFLFSPGPEGKDVEIVFTKPARDGSGADIYFQVKLDKARFGFLQRKRFRRLTTFRKYFTVLYSVGSATLA